MSQVQSGRYTRDSCRQLIPVCGGVSYGSLEGGYRQLCNRCFNEEIARTNGVDFQHVEFQPLEMLDAKQFGRMLMGFEGWQFKLEIYDRSKEI